MENKDARLAELDNWVSHFEWIYIKDHYSRCRILDFGCRFGFGDVYLAREGFSVYGYDIDEDAIGVAHFIREQEEESVKQRLRYGSNLPDDRFDLVWLSHVLEHVPETQFSDLFQAIESYECPILISVPLDHNYDMPLHVNYWKSDIEFLNGISHYSGRNWTAWIDSEHGVIKAETA